MKFLHCLIGVLWLAAFDTICLGHHPVVAGSPQPVTKAPDAAFLVKPYLQLGDAPPGSMIKDLALLWHTDDAEPVWSVEYQTRGRRDLAHGHAPHFAPHRHPWHCATPGFPGSLEGLGIGARVFLSRAQGWGSHLHGRRARSKGPGQSIRFVSFGDCGAGTAQQKAVAYQTYLARPDFLMITGDIVYSRGRISRVPREVLACLQCRRASPLVGAPLLRSTLFVAAPGNHDIAEPRPGEIPRRPGLFPLLGCSLAMVRSAWRGHACSAALRADANQQAFIDAAGGDLPADGELLV